MRLGLVVAVVFAVVQFMRTKSVKYVPRTGVDDGDSGARRIELYVLVVAVVAVALLAVIHTGRMCGVGELDVVGFCAHR
jgi:hypothetical protein